MASTQQLDVTLLNGYLEALDLAILQQMLELYMQQSALYLTIIATAVAAGDQQAWQDQCHKMKGSAASAGLCQVQQKLSEIEKSTEDWPIKAEHLCELTELNEQAIEAFKYWLAKQ